MLKREIILLPKLQYIEDFFKKNEIFICSCCDMPSEKSYFSNKINKCDFCNLNNHNKKNTLVFTFKVFIYGFKILKKDFLEKLINILSKYKFINFNIETFLFFINFKNIENNKSFENYLNSFFEEMFDFLNVKNNFKINKHKFCNSYVYAIKTFIKNKKRPLGKRILMPCFNIKYKISKRELINLRNILA